ncbi:hypothetical protein FRC05_011435 [Tulasnella sp. 425]|nr:hypothetical protein FRC05_011435 [Tulasnella sp. 425]
MEEQEPRSGHIPSPGGGETPHPRTGPDQGGSRIDTAAKNKQAEEGNKDGINDTANQAADSDVGRQERPGAGQSLTAGDQKSGQAPAEAIKPQEPMDNSMAPGVKRSPVLTRMAKFWERYDRLADTEDKKLSENLNANLDVLLIFAALFSAVNTTFISMTMPSLSPDPLDRTNTLLELLVKRVDNTTLTPSDLTPSFSQQASSVAINFLLYASLCCSLLAAMGAMLGKEWLQSFGRSGQTGAPEEQGRLRQRKFNGILQWHLEGVILFLPNLLLFSVTLFFAGLALYLFPINKVVAGLLIAVLGFSAVVWLVTVLVGAIWPLCPYQSAASRALRLVGRRAALYWVQNRLPATQAHKDEVGKELRAKEEQKSNAQAAFWLVKTTSSREDREAVAEFITTFDEDQEIWKLLLQSTQGAFENWQDQPSDVNSKMLEIFGRALSHIILSKSAAEWEFRGEEKSGQLHGVLESFLEGLKSASTSADSKDIDPEVLAHAAPLHALAATGNIYTTSRTWERLFVLMGDFDFSLLNKRITSAFWNAANTLRSLPEPHPETSALEVYTSFLHEIRHVVATDRLPGDLVSLLTYSVAEFIFDLNELWWAETGSPNPKLDKFLKEAWLSLHAMLSYGSLPTSLVRDSTKEASENQPSSTNRKIVESFELAASHVRFPRPENAVKWRVWAEKKPGGLHGVLKRFLKGFETASKRMNDKDIDLKLLTYATSLHTLEAAGDIYTRSRSWGRLFVLMGDFNFSLLHKQITYAFWNAAHALRSLPAFHPETSAFEIYSTFLQEIRHVATPDQLPGDLVTLLNYSVAEFIFDLNELWWAKTGFPDPKLDRFLKESLLSLHSILSCGSLPASLVRDSTKEASENQPSSTNRKIVESFELASSHVPFPRPQSAVKWRVRAEEKPGKLHGVLEHFLKGFGAASKRMNDKDIDWKLLTYATSLHTLEAAGDIYTRSRSWERLFVLMGDFDFSLLHKQITYAFWNAAHALRSLPAFHPETSAFEIYSTFLQEIRHVATPDQLPGDLVSLLTFSAMEFIFDFNESFWANPYSLSLQFDKFLAEALLSLRAIFPCAPSLTSSAQGRYYEFRRRTSWGGPKRTWEPLTSLAYHWPWQPFEPGTDEELMHRNFWPALDSIITRLTKSPPEIKELTVDFVLVAIEWLSISLPSSQWMIGLGSSPQIPTFITSSLAEGNPARQARGLYLFFFNIGHWALGSPGPLDRVWNEVGLITRLVRIVKEPQTWSKGTRLLEVLEAMANHWSWSFMEAGFPLAAAEAIQHIDKTRERLHPEWRDLLRRTLSITLEVWNNTKNSEPNEWAASEILLMVRHSSVHIERSLNSGEEDSRDVLRFVQLIDHLYKRLSLSAFIFCNADLEVRSLFCELRRRVERETYPGSNTGGGAFASSYRISQLIDWTQGLTEGPLICSRPDFVDTQML